MTIAIGGNNISAFYVGSKPVQKVYKGSQLIWSAKFKVGAIIGQAISTKDGSSGYTIDSSKAGWTTGNYKNNYANIIYTFPNFPIYKLPNGIKLRFWNQPFGAESDTISISASDIAKGADIMVDDTWRNVNGTVYGGQVDVRVQMNGKNLEIIRFGAHIELYEITAY